MAEFQRYDDELRYFIPSRAFVSECQHYRCQRAAPMLAAAAYRMWRAGQTAHAAVGWRSGAEHDDDNQSGTEGGGG